MTFTERAQELLAAVRAEENEDKQILLLTIALVRATADVCQVCQTGVGNGRGKLQIRCAICHKEPEVIVCFECCQKHKVPSWGS